MTEREVSSAALTVASTKLENDPRTFALARAYSELYAAAREHLDYCGGALVFRSHGVIAPAERIPDHTRSRLQRACDQLYNLTPEP